MGRALVISTRSWRLAHAGAVVGLAVGAERIRVAQARGITDLARAHGGILRQIALPAGARIVALSRGGARIAARMADGLRVGSPVGFDPTATAVGDTGTTPIVFDGPHALLFTDRLWDLGTSAAMWRETYTASAAASDDHVLAIGQDDGSVTLLRVADGSVIDSRPRASRGRYGAALTAIDVASRHVVSLDREGWVSCDSASAPVLPPGLPNMAAAIGLVPGGAWVLRGGRAVLVHCDRRSVEVLCEETSARADLNTAALAVYDGRAYAAGLLRGTIVELPECGR